MTLRIFASSVAILGIGLVLAPVAASARGGGVAAGRAFSVRGAGPHVGPAVVHPGAPVMRPAIGGGAAAGFGSPLVEGVGAAVHSVNFHTTKFRHRPPFRWSQAAWGGWEGGTYDSAIDAIPYDPYALPAVDDVAARVTPVREPGCTVQIKTVPSEAGGERAIRIVRCY